LSFTTHPDQALPSELHAGDEIAVLTEAKRPQVFKDEGAFDRRAYLEQQDIHLMATLRAPQLIERISVALARLGDLARERKIPIEHELQGKKFSWDGVEGEFLWPELSPGEIAPNAKNDDSLVLRLRFGNQGTMLPGDVEKESERTILAENDATELRTDILKIGHHGSKNSTMPEFLAAVQPRIGIISSGEANPYGHPSRSYWNGWRMRVFRFTGRILTGRCTF